MKSFFLLRHALATRALTGYGPEILTAEILPEGLAPIQRMAAFLKEIPSDIQLVSPVKRCQQTAQVISQITSQQFETDGRLTEFQGENPEETFDQLADRCQQVLDELNSQSVETIFMCTHGAVIATLKYLILSGHFQENEQYDYPATGELWVIRNGKVEAFDFN